MTIPNVQDDDRVVSAKQLHRTLTERYNACDISLATFDADVARQAAEFREEQVQNALERRPFEYTDGMLKKRQKLVAEREVLRIALERQARAVREAETTVARELAPAIFPHYAAIVRRVAEALRAFADAAQEESAFRREAAGKGHFEQAPLVALPAPFGDALNPLDYSSALIRFLWDAKSAGYLTGHEDVFAGANHDGKFEPKEPARKEPKSDFKSYKRQVRLLKTEAGTWTPLPNGISSSSLSA
jgi:hypothetical protein